MTGDRHIALETLPWIDVDSRLKKREVHGGRMSMTNYHFAPGGRFPNHVHSQEQITYCLEGSMVFVVDGHTMTLEAGHLVVIPSGVEHSAEAGPDGAEVLSMVSPSRAALEGGGITVREKRTGSGQQR